MFESWDEYEQATDYGIYFGFNYSAGSSSVTAASAVQDFHLYFGQLQGPTSTLAELAARSNGRIVPGPDGKFYTANSDHKPAAMLGLDADPTGAIGTNCTGSVLSGALKGGWGGVKAFAWDGWYSLGDQLRQRTIDPLMDGAFDVYELVTGTKTSQAVMEEWQARFKREMPVAERLASYTLAQLDNPDGDFGKFAEGFMDTFNDATSAEFNKDCEHLQFALAGIASVLKTGWHDLNNGCPERRAEIMGRLVFEAATILYPAGKASQAGRVARLGEAEGEMLAKAEQFSSVVHEVPEVAQAVTKQIPRNHALQDVQTHLSGKLQSGAELAGTKFAVQKVEGLGFEVQGKLTYGANNGIDMWMKGIGANEGRFAVVEAKGGSSATSLSCLAVSGGGSTTKMRQMTRDWVLDRLFRAGRQDLIDAFFAGKLDFYVALEGSGEVWKLNPALYAKGTKSASKIAGAATRVYP